MQMRNYEIVHYINANLVHFNLFKYSSVKVTSIKYVTIAIRLIHRQISEVY